MNSFYGGPNGLSFTITKIFSSKNGDSDSLVWDLSLRWTSLITVGSFVVVSYGMPSDSTYNLYKDIDIQRESKSFNSTLWRKEYYERQEDEDSGYRVRGQGGLSYRLIASLTGSTPVFDVGTTVVDANVSPNVVVNEDDPDLPHLLFSLPQAQLFLDDNITSQAIDADLLPYIDVDCESTSEKVNHPTLKFYLPLALHIVEAQVDLYLDANQKPSVKLDTQKPNSVNKPVLKFLLPVSQVFTSEHVTSRTVDANVEPSVSMGGSVNEPTLTFSLPQAQVLSVGELTVLDVGQDPKIDYNLDNINEPVITFSLPKSQNIKDAIIEQVLPVGQDPEVTLDKTGENGVNEPVLKFKLPASQEIIEKNVSYEPINADQPPRVEFSLGDDPNHPTLKFFLPKSLVMGEPKTLTVGPNNEPSVSIDSNDINAPFLNFLLPKAVHFYYGDLLGDPTKVEEPFEDTNEAYTGYEVGDYYINVPSGFIYVVTKVSGTTVTFRYLACLLAPLPELLDTVVLSPYTGQEPTNPLVDMSVDEANHKWTLTFSLPKMPKFDIDKDFIAAPAEEGSVGTSIIDNDTVKFSFKIPRGSRLFNGEGSPSAVEGAKNGDYYLDMLTGKIYLYSAQSWRPQSGSLLGPVGNALNVAASYRITETEENTNTLEHGTNYIEKQYLGDIGPEDIFAITWVSQDGSNEISYWQFKTGENKWDRVLLTGGIDSILAKEYSTDTNKAYNTEYVNSLINANEENKDKTTYSKEQIEKLLSWGTFAELKEG